MALRTAAEWSKQICNALNTIDPQISTEVGDPIRKIIDATASVAAAIDLNSQTNMGFFDLDSKTGTDLDAIASWLGFGRRDGLAAVGEVRFYLDLPATMSMEIPAGTQVTDGTVTFRTTNACVINQFETEVNCSIQCDTVGVIGNVNAYTINQVLSTYASNGLKVENAYDTRNGVDIETDAELRKRIRQTFLRNVAGTEDAYRGISEMVTATRKVNVVGPIERWEEQLEVVQLPSNLGGGWGFQSMIPCSKFTWPRQTYLVREPDTDNERMYVEGVDYTVDSSYDPTHPIVRIIAAAGELDLENKTGSELDAVGEAIGCPRYLGTQAVGSAVFGFDVAKGSNYVIKAGARLQDASGNIYLTQQDATIYSQSLSSSAVQIKSQENKDIRLGSGQPLTYIDRTGFKCMVSDPIQGGAAAWTDAEYRTEIVKAFGEKIDVTPGDFLFFKHEYCSVDSRNEPAENPPLVNKVDVFIDGQDTQNIRECAQIKLKSLTSDKNSKWCVDNFYYEDGSHPLPGTKIQVLGYNPVVALPKALNINGSQYTKYQLIKGQDLTKGSTREIGAIAFQPGSNIPSDGSFLELRYDYNRAVMVTDQLLDTNRQITTDVLCHEANKIGLTVNLIVQNVLGASDDALLADVNNLLDIWANNLEFGSWIQWSDILYAVRTSRYVDAARMAMASDAGRTITSGDDAGQPVKAGIQITEQFKHFLDEQQDADFRLRDSMLPYIYKVNIVREASNTYL